MFPFCGDKSAHSSVQIIQKRRQLHIYLQKKATTLFPFLMVDTTSSSSSCSSVAASMVVFSTSASTGDSSASSAASIGASLGVSTTNGTSLAGFLAAVGLGPLGVTLLTGGGAAEVAADAVGRME